MEMAFFEPLPNHKQLKHCVLTLWFKDSGGTTKKRTSNGVLFFCATKCVTAPSCEGYIFSFAHSLQMPHMMAKEDACANSFKAQG